MIYIESPSRDPYFNLALEEYAFEYLDKSQEYFILWQNANTIVIGNYQNTAEEINQAFVDQKGIKVARRLSGGGAVYHDNGNLNFTYIVHRNGQDLFNFEAFAAPIVKVLRDMGLKAEFSGRNDLLLDGKKISGSSQYMRKDRILNHGCIMLDSNMANVTDALRPKDAKFESKSVKSVRSRITTINANLKEPITMEAFKAKIVKELHSREGIQTRTLTREDYRNIEKLRDEKYATWEWNYGKSPAYSYRRECKFDFGLVCALAEIEKGVIEEVKLYGDFFGNGDIRELESALQGERLDEGFADRMDKKIDLNDYIRGMKPRDLKALFQ